MRAQMYDHLERLPAKQLCRHVARLQSKYGMRQLCPMPMHCSKEIKHPQHSMLPHKPAWESPQAHVALLEQNPQPKQPSRTRQAGLLTQLRKQVCKICTTRVVWAYLCDSAAQAASGGLGCFGFASFCQPSVWQILAADLGGAARTRPAHEQILLI